MSSLPVLPDKILQTLVCQECFRYLSVPPIGINALKEIVCGRCFDTNRCQSSHQYTESFYNLIAEGFLFKCINHYNGCNQLFGLDEANEHEKKCIMPDQECFFCSFSGVLSQVFYHSLKVHSENVTYDGKFYFYLNDMSYQEKKILILNDNMFIVTISATDELFTFEVATITRTLSPITNQFGVKFFKPDDSSNVDYLHTNYGLLDVNLTNYFEKSKEELTAAFGPGENVCCQILVGQFSLQNEQEFKEKFLKLSHYETELNTLKTELEIKEQGFLQQTTVWEQKLSERDQLYDSAIDIIKKMSLNFKCYSCQTVVLGETQVCPKNHFYCKTCLRNICEGCHSMQEYKQLDEIGNLLVPCDWPDCTEMLCVKDYMEHKRSCLKRRFTCCLREVTSWQDLLEHCEKFHDSVPLTESSISCSMNQNINCCWLVNGDLYEIVLKLDQTIQVSIKEIDVLPNNITFKCQGTNSEGQTIHFSDFCGKYDINITNKNNYYKSINISFA